MTHTTTINRPEGLLVKLNTWHSRRRLLADMCTGYKSLRLLSGYGGESLRMVLSSSLKILLYIRGSIPTGSVIKGNQKAMVLTSSQTGGEEERTHTPSERCL